MAEFSPLDDYFGLNALVTRLMSVSTAERFDRIEEDSCDIARSSHIKSDSPPRVTSEAVKLQDFDIIKMSRVFNERANNSRRKRKPLNYCVFCRNNGESEQVYASHQLKSDSGVVLCPILRAYTCPLCGCNGDRAHTIKYCRLNSQSRRM